MATKDETRAALAHAVEVFAHLVEDSKDDVTLSDDLGEAHRAEVRTLEVLRFLLVEAQESEG